MDLDIQRKEKEKKRGILGLLTCGIKNFFRKKVTRSLDRLVFSSLVYLPRQRQELRQGNQGHG